ncbi:histidine phosphatase family protein [Enterococcus casseliflavus]|uniref:histidine phosphatase family protein n=1 Tax=Enterococcus casseliflavus TaxID=37734 RepID=UPI0014328CC1|nr:histidine phosphatase family protein [Enterococcus casseliflavus]NKD39209.1 histidine phosphatase family protein [Enterococcus casseliflavus]
MKRLYLMRHGETLFNKLGKVQGWCDSPLTETGKKQAHKAKAYFAINQLTFGHAVASTQERACDTLEIICGTTDYERRKGLKEMNFGLFEGESTHLQPKGPKAYEHFYQSFGGESAAEVRQRMFAELIDIMTTTKADNTLVVSHNGAIFYFFKHLFPNEVPPLRLANCGFMVFTYENGHFFYLETVDPTKAVTN